MAEQRVFVDNPATNPVNVTGSVTSTPGGTQDVNVVSPNPLPTSPTGTQNVSLTASSATVSTTPVRSAAIDGVFVFSIGNVTGVAAANNYLTLFNPVGSGKTVSFGSAFISSTAAGGTSVTDPMQGFRITAASGGTLQVDSAVAKFISSEPDPVAEVRTGTVTATLGPQVFNSPPALASTVGSTNVHIIPVPGGLAPFLLAEGEGIAFRQAVGDVDLRWNMSIVWAEI